MAKGNKRVTQPKKGSNMRRPEVHDLSWATPITPQEFVQMGLERAETRLTKLRMPGGK